MSDNVDVKLGKLETKVDYIIDEIKDLKDNYAARLAKLEDEKASKEIVKQNSQDIDLLKRYLYLGLGALTVIDVLIYYYIHH
jgi:hypothetical protein